ncbi:MAG TPA: beta-L-arabinofuranosidase domain-containing protein [Dongiaceae bacterium]|nr:beta-L-arabinofuranosidase domain-containing protein [Dongiaceae bacterium]
MNAKASARPMKLNPKLRRLGSAAFLAALCVQSQVLCLADANVTAKVVAVPPASRGNALYPANRSPLTPSPLIKLPIGSVIPKGWLRAQLELEAGGMTGHLEEISQWCKFDDSAWASPSGQGKFGWEELPYWLKGYGDLGYVLNDPRIIRGARKWIDATLSSQEADGYFGPRANKTGLDGHPDLWPHMVMLNVLQSFYEFSGDDRVLPFMTRYLKWLNAQPPDTFGRGYWPKIRFGDTLESAHWLYNRTGEAWLLDLGKKIHEHMARWDTGVINWHNVNISQGFREPGVYYEQAGDEKLLEAAEGNYQAVMGVYGQFPGGGFAGDENCRPGYVDPRQGFETCGIVEFMHSFEMLAKISGNPLWADRCEELAFNSLPAALTPDLKGLHYLTCPNQVQLDKENKSPGVQNGGTMFSYSPYEVYRCCQHNVSHGWPYYAEELWLATADRGLCASLYAASQVTAKVGAAASVTISEDTDYPFSDRVEFKLAATQPVRFPLYLRIPRWCAAASLAVNGETVPLDSKALAYAVLDRTWKDGDRLSLRLPMKLSVRKWARNHDSVSVDYGPLTFSLKIGERYARYGGTPAWPETEVFPTTPWNYGLVLEAQDPAESFEVVTKPGPVPAQPFTPETAPIQLRARAKKLPAWKQDSLGLVGKLQPSPVKSDQPLETVTLIPMGAARLRISAFPVIGEGEGAHEWTVP